MNRLAYGLLGLVTACATVQQPTPIEFCQGQSQEERISYVHQQTMLKGDGSGRNECADFEKELSTTPQIRVWANQEKYPNACAAVRINRKIQKAVQTSPDYARALIPSNGILISVKMAGITEVFYGAYRANAGLEEAILVEDEDSVNLCPPSERFCKDISRQMKEALMIVCEEYQVKEQGLETKRP